MYVQRAEQKYRVKAHLLDGKIAGVFVAYNLDVVVYVLVDRSPSALYLFFDNRKKLPETYHIKGFFHTY